MSRKEFDRIHSMRVAHAAEPTKSKTAKIFAKDRLSKNGERDVVIPSDTIFSIPYKNQDLIRVLKELHKGRRANNPRSMNILGKPDA